jgi:hypothetical protein
MERNQAIKTTNELLKNIVVQHQVERWKEEEGIETTLLKKTIQYRLQWEMKKMDTQFLKSTK